MSTFSPKLNFPSGSLAQLLGFTSINGALSKLNLTNKETHKFTLQELLKLGVKKDEADKLIQEKLTQIKQKRIEEFLSRLYLSEKETHKAIQQKLVQYDLTTLGLTNEEANKLIQEELTHLKQVGIEKVLSKLDLLKKETHKFTLQELLEINVKKDEADKLIQEKLIQLKQIQQERNETLSKQANQKPHPGWGYGAVIARKKEVVERNTPVTPHSSSRTHFNDEFIALSASTADGVLDLAMEHAFKTGDTVEGRLIFVDSKLQWNYTVICVTYDAKAITSSALLSKVESLGNTLKTEYDKKFHRSLVDKANDFLAGNGSISFSTYLSQTHKNVRSVNEKVNSEYVTNSQHTNIAYRKKGTCNIVGILTDYKSDVSVKDSPQYNAGVERMSKTYAENLRQGG